MKFRNGPLFFAGMYIGVLPLSVVNNISFAADGALSSHRPLNSCSARNRDRANATPQSAVIERSRHDRSATSARPFSRTARAREKPDAVLASFCSADRSTLSAIESPARSFGRPHKFAVLPFGRCYYTLETPPNDIVNAASVGVLQHGGMAARAPRSIDRP